MTEGRQALNNVMENFIQYVTQLEPSFESRIRGASEEEINTLESLAGLSLPASYRAFLSRMGHDSGGIDLAFEGTTRINEIIDYYQNLVLTGKASVPAGCLMIGIASPPTEDLALQTAQGKEGPVFFAVDGELVQLYGDSLDKLLFRVAFAEFRMRPLPVAAYYRNDNLARQRDVADAVAMGIGFQRQWFSDSVEFCGENSTSAIIINQYPDHGLAVLIRAEAESEVESVASVLAQRLGLYRQS